MSKDRSTRGDGGRFTGSVPSGGTGDRDDIETRILDRVLNCDQALVENLMQAMMDLIKMRLGRAGKTAVAIHVQEGTMSIEPLAIQVLMKAIDFLFGEAKSILEERRTARKSNIPAPPDIPLLSQDKETIINRFVDKELTQLKALEIQGILDEIVVYQRNLVHARGRVAREGGPNLASIAAKSELIEQQDAILEVSQRLAAIVDGLA